MKAIMKHEGPFGYFDLYDPSKRRCFGGDIPDEPLDLPTRSDHLNFDSVRLIPYPTVEFVLVRQLENEGPKTHTLDNASDADEDAPIGRTPMRIRADGLLSSRSGAHGYSRSFD